MPELPEVETVRRLLDSTVRGRLIRTARTSRLELHGRPLTGLARALRGRTIRKLERHGKFLLVRLDAGWTLLSHLGMSGRWLFYPREAERGLEHVHLRLDFADGAKLLYQDPRRFGMLRVVADAKLEEDPSLALLGPDPLASPPTGERLAALGGLGRLAVKQFLLDQRRIAGLGNIYASEVLHRAGVDPRRIARSLSRPEWDAIAREIRAVLAEAIERSGTTFSMYRTVWGEPGGYGDRLRVYDRAGEPCRRCATAIRRIIQGQRSTFFCPVCQAAKGRSRKRAPGSPAGPQKAS
jgi:formamidopyrimidine-DNA glycosylase